MIQTAIAKLIQYGIYTELIKPEDAIYTANRLLELLHIGALEEKTEEKILNERADESIVGELENILGTICDYAYEQGIMEENSIGYRDLFDTKVMGLLVDRPSNIIVHFQELYARDPKKATDFYYKFSQDTDYIRRYRIARDKKWVVSTPYGDLDITINLSKPEKDPRAIAAAKLAKQTAYPKCLLCKENEGFAGHLNHPARQNHRIIPLTIHGSSWRFQYSPYVYYNEHCIVFNSEHIPMKIERATFAKLLDFVALFPHYFVGSNADLPIVGGSILSHDHFQGGHYEFAMAKAPVETEISFQGFDDVKAGIVKWPMSVIRLNGREKERLIDLADKILMAWRGYTDEASFVFAETNGEPHNTITPIARMRDDRYELDLVLRNNITTAEHPLGVYHPHAELHHIKKENIGLIEVMGLAVLPARLKGELERLKEAILAGADLTADPELEKHAAWAEELREKYGSFEAETLENVLQQEVGIVFMKVLEHAGVYKHTEDGREGFLRFVHYVNA
ncbi:MAG: UDP-glucose--hexose-1-phosphate uridylyltransferase [Brotaphodocola sp.]